MKEQLFCVINFSIKGKLELNQSWFGFKPYIVHDHLLKTMTSHDRNGKRPILHTVKKLVY